MIKEMIKNKKFVIGSKVTLKKAKLGYIETIILAKDLNEKIKEEIKEIAKIGKIKVIETEKTKKDIGEELNKPFSIGCIGIYHATK
ncbi:MAG: ribosomal L7Ae/L30e/S12e/Gadd45 family protein [Candidatus Pacearchaeota archaeon]